MKKHLKCILSLFAALLVSVAPVAGIFGAGGLVANSEEIMYKAGEVVEFGSYPQTQVTDESLISELDAIDADEHGFQDYYKYVQNSGYEEDSWMMRYKDVTHNGEKYRGVVIHSYRPSITSSVYQYSSQQGRFERLKYYWFKYEPLKWKVFDAEKGLALCENIIDSQPINNAIRNDGCLFESRVIYANDFGYSYLEEWLNNTFLNTAFSAEEQEKLQETTLDLCNASGSSGSNRAAACDCKVMLMTYKQAVDDEYDGEVEAIVAKEEIGKSTTDFWTGYSLVQGANIHGYWWIATPDSGNVLTFAIKPSYYDEVDDYEYPSRILGVGANNTDVGVRPVINLSNVLTSVTVSEEGAEDADSAGGLAAVLPDSIPTPVIIGIAAAVVAVGGAGAGIAVSKKKKNKVK